MSVRGGEITGGVVGGFFVCFSSGFWAVLFLSHSGASLPEVVCSVVPWSLRIFPFI